jgi:hypothetical protein
MEVRDENPDLRKYMHVHTHIPVHTNAGKKNIGDGRIMIECKVVRNADICENVILKFANVKQSMVNLDTKS